MKLLQARNISKKVKIPQQSICEKFTYISFEQDSHSTMDFDYITRPRNHDLHASSFGDNNSSEYDNAQRLAELPTAFWPQTSPHVMRDEIIDSKVPSMKARLKHSPFGDPITILERNKQQKQTSKLCQQKLKEGTSRLLKKTHPNKVLRTTQRKKLYPSQPEYHRQQQQQQQQTSRSRMKHSGPIEVPPDTVQHKVVAEKLFASSSSRPASAVKNDQSSAGNKQQSDNKDLSSTTVNDTPSSMDHLSYAERLQVMILQCQDSHNVDSDDDED